jgi:hypothetical protein
LTIPAINGVEVRLKAFLAATAKEAIADAKITKEEKNAEAGSGVA